jgi:mannose-1-phosphate guanylyltransferase
VEVEPVGVRAADEGLDGVELHGRALVGDRVEIGSGVRLDGPLVIGPGARIGDGANVRESVLLAGAEVPARGVLAGAIAGNVDHLGG